MSAPSEHNDAKNIYMEMQSGKRRTHHCNMNSSPQIFPVIAKACIQLSTSDGEATKPYWVGYFLSTMILMTVNM